jgi:hypothetical protein
MVKDKKIDDADFDRVMILALAFEENKKHDLKISWEEIKPEIEKLSETQLALLLRLVKNEN